MGNDDNNKRKRERKRNESTSESQPFGGAGALPFATSLHQTCRKFKISSPKTARGEQLEEHVIVGRAEADGFRDDLDDDVKKKCISYLYGREFFWGDQHDHRRKKEIFWTSSKRTAMSPVRLKAKIVSPSGEL